MLQKLKDIKFGTKLLAAFLTVGIIPLTITGLISLQRIDSALEKQALAQLESVREIKKAQVEKFFNERRDDMDVLMETVATLKQEAFSKVAVIQSTRKSHLENYFSMLMSAIHALKDNPTTSLAINRFENAFIYEKKKTGGALWTAIENELGPVFEDAKKDFDFYNLFLITKDGDVVYSVEKESDIGENLFTGKLQDSGLAHAFEGSKTQEISIWDFEPYAPSGGMPAAFIAGEVKDENGNRIGAVALQAPTGPLNSIVQSRERMGKTGETYLAGKHRGRIAFRSNMTTMGNGKYVIGYDITEIATSYIHKALSGENGESIFTDTKGKMTIVNYSPLDLEGLNWAMITKIDLEEIIAPKLEGNNEDFFAKYIKKYGYYDLFLIHPNGKVFYSVTHESDYGTNMVNGKYANSGLGKLVQKVLKTKVFGFADFESYPPSNDDPAAFIAKPVLHKGNVELIVALQISIDNINAIMQQRQGMGKTGETYLVGADKFMRSDSYLSPESHSVKASFTDHEKGKVDTEASREALSGRTGEKIIIDYAENQVLSAYTPVKVWDTTWALIAEINVDEAYASVNTMRIIFGIALITALLAVVGMAILFTRAVTGPVKKTVNFIKKVQEGDNNITLEPENKDEIGQMGSALNRMVLTQRKMLKNLNELPAPVMEIDKDFNVVYLNNAGVKIAGLKPDEAIGKKCYDLFKTEDCGTENCACARAMKKNRKVTSETRANPGSMSNLPIRYTGMPIEEKGEVTGALEFITDMTATYNVVEELRNIIEKLAVSSEELSKISTEMASSSEEMNAQCETVAASAEEVSASVGTVASAAEESGTSASSVAAMTEEMSSTFKNVAELSQQTAKNVNNTAQSGKEMSADVNSVAVSINEMSSSLKEVAQHTDNATDISGDANKQAEEINVKMEALVTASKQIGKVIAVIKDIADQTNMLALNAAIEAAGAGEAGKGFAVVAGEVKELAKQSADATDEIAGQIENIQKSTQEAVGAIEKINSVINEVSSINKTIADAVETQTSTSDKVAKTIANTAKNAEMVANSASEASDLVKEIADSSDELSTTADESAKHVAEMASGASDIARSSNEAAIAVQDISKNIQGVSIAAKDTSESAIQTSNSAITLSELTAGIREIVSKFKL
ncbi:methyl-accepting chemotaxis protein [Candidatus Magnetomoraceae bacterium gMMP-15]